MSAIATSGPATPATELVSSFLDALASDLDAACGLLADDVVVDEANSLVFGGERTGIDGFRSMIADLMGAYRVRLGDHVVRDAGDVVLVTLTARLESRRTGQAGEMTVVDIYTVENGRIARIDVFYKDTHAVVEINGSN